MVWLPWTVQLHIWVPHWRCQWSVCSGQLCHGLAVRLDRPFDHFRKVDLNAARARRSDACTQMHPAWIPSRSSSYSRQPALWLRAPVLAASRRVYSRLGRRMEASDPSKRLGCSRRSEEHTSELQSLAYLVCRLLLE